MNLAIWRQCLGKLEPLRRSTLLVTMLVSAAAPGSLACDFPSFDGIHGNEALLGLIDDFGATASPNAIEPQKSARAIVYQVSNRLQVEHGHTCARSNGGAYVHESAVIPRQYADTGTIIFNGALAMYSGGVDHNVTTLGGVILNVENRGNAELHWDAAGALNDGEAREFEWCYFYTLVFWRPSSVFRASIPPSSEPRLNGEFGRPAAAVHDIVTSLQAADGFGGPRALLPRGSGHFFRDDHNLLQVGYDMKMPTIAGDTISWRSQTVLQDESPSQPYISAEIVEVMNGASVNMWQPTQVWHQANGQWVQEEVSFRLKARSPGNICGSVKTAIDHYVVDVPFSYAVPMLTGWKLGGVCQDSNVQLVGSYVDNFNFVPYPNGRSGRLSYTVTSALSDDSAGRLEDRGSKVTVLGFNPISRFPDLTPPLPPVVLAP
jgi:hypothetical protein